MEEKEERIYVRQYGEDNPCDTCEDTSGEECDFCVKNYEWNKSISRQKSIERMAKALIRADYPNAQKSVWDMRWDNPASKDYYFIMANSALNALLEGNK